jgi:hypothetical protein
MEGILMGLTMQQKQAVTREMPGPLSKGSEKSEAGSARRIYPADRLPPEIHHLALKRQTDLRLRGGESGKAQAGKKRPSNRTGIPMRSLPVSGWSGPFSGINAVGNEVSVNLCPLMRQQMRYLLQWPAFHITPGLPEKLTAISPASIDRYLRKDKAALKLKGKSLTNPPDSLKSRSPIQVFYTSDERKKPGF